MELFDTHSHYNDEKFDLDRDEIIEETFASGVTKFICAGYSIESSLKAVEISKKKEYIYSIIGISPNDIPDNIEGIENNIKKLKDIFLNNKKIVGIGEIGLDYYWKTENKELQKKYFIRQIELANELNLPIIIHTREAVMDTLNILRENEVIRKGIFHCCPLNRELVKEAIKLGFYISFAGPITFKNTKNAEEIVKMVPNNRILIETDSPYLAPEPLRGTRNNSKNVRYVLEKIAEFKQINKEEMAEITYKNAESILGLE